MPNRHIIYIGSLGNDITEGDLSIHQFVLDFEFNIKQHNIIPINERVRDLIYIKRLNKIFMFLESSGSIGVLENIKEL